MRYACDSNIEQINDVIQVKDFLCVCLIFCLLDKKKFPNRGVSFTTESSLALVVGSCPTISNPAPEDENLIS